MNIRKIIFWTHLCLAIPAAVFIFLMSATGVLLTYEHAIVEWVASQEKVEAPEGARRMSVDEMAAVAKENSPEDARLSLNFANRENAPVAVRQGRSGEVLLDPYTGEISESRAAAVGDWFHEIVAFHRWLGLEGVARDRARAINGASNLVFLFLAVSGLYLWLPKVMKWVFFRQHLFFMKKYPTAKARDFNWHHVFGIWALIPIILMTVSGAMFYYPWANKLLYGAFGEEAPTRGGPPGGGRGGPGEQAEPAPVPEGLATLQMAFDAASETDPEWDAISMPVIGPRDTSVGITVYNGGRLPRHRVTQHYDLAEGAITRVEGIDEMSPGRKARIWMRYIHTGEQYGIIGSTIAGLSSLAGCFLVYTGLALAFRRLILPLFRKKKKMVVSVGENAE